MTTFRGTWKQRLVAAEDRITALEAAAKPPGDLRWADEYYRQQEQPARDRQAERADALERELGIVREQLRVAAERVESAERECADAVAMADRANQRAQANQSAADTLERLKRFESVDGQRLVNEEGPAARIRIERDALAEQVKARDVAIAAQDAGYRYLEQRLADSEERERGHIATIGEKCDKIAELTRRLSERSDEIARLNAILDKRDPAMVRDAERWRWVWRHSRVMGFSGNTSLAFEFRLPGDSGCNLEKLIDAAIASKKEGKV